MPDIPDNGFSKWVLSVTASAVIAIGGALLGLMWKLSNEVTTLNTQMISLSASVDAVSAIQLQVSDHEYRIRWIERTPVDNTRSNTGRAYRQDTVRSSYSR